MVPEPRIMPPRRFKKKYVRNIVEKHVAKAIEKYEKTRADSNNSGGSGSTNTGGTVAPEVHGYIGLANANHPWSNVKAMFDTEYWPRQLKSKGWNKSFWT
ncbi:hypothetical protein Tco_0784164, partial [Tanacetum coccineum]